MSGNWQVTDEEFFTLATTDGNPVEELDELADGFKGYDGLDFAWNVQQVAERIYNIHGDRPVEAMFLFSLTCNADGEIDGGDVMLSIPLTGFYLVESLEWKHMTNDRNAIGRAGLLAIKNCLLESYERMLAFAIGKGLI
jgi:hypothetical protein